MQITQLRQQLGSKKCEFQQQHYTISCKPVYLNKISAAG